MDRFDLVVIGGGIGGYTCAIRASQLGKRVALIEQREIGGTCLNRGCIPTKALLRSAELYDLFKSSENFGVSADNVRIDLDRMMQRKSEVVSKLRGGVEYLLKKADVKVIKGKGEIAEKNRVKVNGDTIETENIVIATGSEPAQLLGTDGERVVTSDEALSMHELPGSMVIVGAGAIGIEFAVFLSSLGTKVKIIEMMDHVLPALNDDKTTKLLSSALRRKGIEIKTGSKIERMEKEQEVTAILEGGERISAERALVSIGRKLNSPEGMVKTERGRIIVNERMETSVESIYAIGDVTGGLMLAHKAMHEGIVAAENVAGAKKIMDYSVIPSVVYSKPEVAWVGLTEKEVKEPLIGECPFSANSKALCDGESYGNAKIVAEKSGKIAGAQIIGPQASMLIEEIALAIKAKASLEDISELVHPHPSLNEVIFEACSRTLGRSTSLL